MVLMSTVFHRRQTNHRPRDNGPCATAADRSKPVRARSAPTRRVARLLLADRQLLHGPAIAVGVFEKDERARGKVCNLTHLNPAAGQLAARLVHVRYDELQAARGAGRGIDDPLPEGDRAR